MTIKAKHDLVVFKPLSMSVGPITNLTEKTEGDFDIWIVETSISSIDQLTKPFSGELEYSVPSLGMQHQKYKVWYVFDQALENAATVPKKTAKSKSSAGKVSKEKTTKQIEQVANTPVKNPVVEEAARKNNAASKKSTKTKTIPFNLAKKQKELGKYAVKKQATLAEVPLISYPFLPVIGIFACLDLVIISWAIIFRKKRTRKDKE
ncbi:hypothetical protein FC52_GL000951 [Lactobacillus pasteurii DSM 23907 = CRBIP 24.76]|uniref:NEAT domain-containing protein n=1 Tax=Lactobacillus pasteurii DSM 23907 = CRBIP 24.76 TaxID=1423790 RepID=I7KKX2_9LACO|nr:hypothetical protein [Lactobacillus pasteurii]KRK08215.1 hypothetical protein FC52_GL000951 [Lactobacillus pasteurii DSM 23907 = CRBIP 24.76]TDG77334.1 hypothetical protein C5L33_000777 [Lactobacillus pasteurii]CCI84879.1 Putative uncharacterized protein [Lactobacillus pasteurii DSM 23907 = CRBIP 24.76]